MRKQKGYAPVQQDGFERLFCRLLRVVAERFEHDALRKAYGGQAIVAPCIPQPVGGAAWELPLAMPHRLRALLREPDDRSGPGCSYASSVISAWPRRYRTARPPIKTTVQLLRQLAPWRVFSHYDQEIHVAAIAPFAPGCRSEQDHAQRVRQFDDLPHHSLNHFGRHSHGTTFRA